MSGKNSHSNEENTVKMIQISVSSFFRIHSKVAKMRQDVIGGEDEDGAPPAGINSSGNGDHEPPGLTINAPHHGTSMQIQLLDSKGSKRRDY